MYIYIIHLSLSLSLSPSRQVRLPEAKASMRSPYIYIYKHAHVYICIYIYTYIYISYSYYTWNVRAMYSCTHMRPHCLDQVGGALPQEAPRLWSQKRCSTVQLSSASTWHILTPNMDMLLVKRVWHEMSIWQVRDLIEALEPWNCVVDAMTVNCNSETCRNTRN